MQISSNFFFLKNKTSFIISDSANSIIIKEAMGGGTEAFPDLGKHCQRPDCHQLDFLPFNCDGCHKVFCVDHRSHKSHECPNSDHNSRRVLICEACSAAVEVTGCKGEAEENRLLERHAKSGNCDPKNKRKSTCPVRRCKEVLTFSNTSVCKTCQIKLCLRHRFPADHACTKAMLPAAAATVGGRSRNEKFLAAFSVRNGKDCGNGKSERNVGSSSVSTKSNPSVKAY